MILLQKSSYMPADEMSVRIVFRKLSDATARVDAQHSMSYTVWYGSCSRLKGGPYIHLNREIRD